MIKLEIENRVKAYRVNRKNLNFLLNKTIKILERTTKGIIQLTFVHDAEIRQLNREYRGFNKSTDVLSFGYPVGTGRDLSLQFPDKNIIGEIIISIETAERQAKKHKKTPEQEIQFLFVHGLLHVFGFYHKLSRERKIMFELQDKIVGTIPVGNKNFCSLQSRRRDINL